MKIFKTVLLCSLLIASTAKASSLEEQQSVRDRVLATKGAVEQGELIFTSTCALCHGHAGSGGQGRPLAKRSFDPDRWFTTISKGRTRGSNRMPAYDNSLSEEQRWQVITYLQSLSN